MRSYGTILHKLVCRRANRRQYAGTFFFRNRPELELMRRLAGQKPPASILNIAVLGCSIGAEIYSILWTIRATRPDLNVRLCAVDNSTEVLKIAEEAVYTSKICDFVGASIFERLTEADFRELFEGDKREAKVRSWLREGISWHLSDAGDRELIRILGPQDMVVASNFLCHMAQADAEKCLWKIARLVTRGGYLFVSGIDLDIRTKVAFNLGWEPARDLLVEIHDGDSCVRADWPWAWWGLEPLNRKRHDWQTRYAAAFRIRSPESRGHRAAPPQITKQTGLKRSIGSAPAPAACQTGLFK